ncbi:protein BREAKING OF ASYMMETRY IN THE STOMATAL LINEAGE [Citrus sinensis]|uniref:Uncharacterized protein n=1 Tax=Citrus clementina TaxID=85681 RepID=V4T1K4_CITCL|nr:hypothetical protein CICLE_v10024235mg [Citrus x clementina]KAH9722340.1 protein BREAKING OF ASYMMETRY IN THE STOMATAL LINEAGE [Citrus sinensis]
MWIHWSVTRLVRWRVRDWASCFTACRFPLENASSINNDASWPSFADEDYIVFCFKEDGAFDVVKDCKSEASNHIECTRRSSWYINRKKDEEEESIFMDAETPSSRIQREYQIEEMVSAGSSDSYQSDNSTGSFAFPVLGWEWMGSPAQWPKSEGLQLRKNKTRSLTFQCCRF